MPAGGTTQRKWVAAERIAVVFSAVLVFQMFVAATATPLQSTASLAPPPTSPPPPAVAAPRPIPTAQAGTVIGSGWAAPVAAATARHIFDYRNGNDVDPTVIAPIEPPSAGPGDDPDEVVAIGPVETIPPPLPALTQYSGLTVNDDPASRYRLEVDTRRRLIQVTILDMPGIAFEIDYRDNANDQHRAGVTPVIDDHRLEGNFHRDKGELTFPLVTPTFDAGKVTYTTVTNEDDALFIRFDGGPYTNLRAGRDNDGSTYLEVRIDVTERRVRMDLAGLYYVRPAVGAKLFVTTETKTTSIGVDAERPSFLKYIEDPTLVEVSDPAYCIYRMRSDVTRLHVQCVSFGTAFELDFDHAYKDRGQTNVQTRLVFPTSIGT